MTPKGRCFCVLAVFAGGFTVEAAEAIAESTHHGKGDDSKGGKDQVVSTSTELLTVPSVLDLLTSLLDNNLLVSKEQPDGGTRLQMLEVVREFAVEHLEKSGEAAAFRFSHARFFSDLANDAEPHLFTERSVEWLEKLDADNDNLRIALGWLLENEAEAASRMVAALRQFWSNRTHLAEARGWLSAALEKSSKAPSEARYKLLNAYSLAVRNQGDFTMARQAAEESLALSRSTDDLPQIVLSCQAVSALETLEGNFSAALELIQESLAISRQLDDEKQIAHSLAALGDILLARGQPSDAREPIEESLEISSRLGFKANVSVNLINLGTVAYYEGEADSAYRHFDDSLAICQEMVKRSLVSCCLDGLAAVASMRDNNELAAILAGTAEGLRESIGYEIELTERLFRDSYVTGVRSTLAAISFDAFYFRGRAMNMDEAILLARDPRLPQKGQWRDFDQNVPGLYEEQTEVIIESRSLKRIVIDVEMDCSPEKR